MNHRTIAPPSPWLMLLEARAPWEYAASLAALPLLERAPRGDGHPVIVYPGLGASERSTHLMRSHLARLGYTVHDWGQGSNRPRPGLLAECGQLLQQVAQREGRKVSLVGWSLGGIYARELAKLYPQHARCVVTLGSPFGGDSGSTNAARVYEWLGGRHVPDDPQRRERLRRAPSVPTTSVYSKSDGVVAWRASLNEEAPHTENVEVHASHTGLGVNPVALYVVADRLRQDPQAWRRFSFGSMPRDLFGARGFGPSRTAQA